MATKCLAAWTAPGGSYPPYVNATKLEAGGVRLTVRGKPWRNGDVTGEGALASCVVPAAEWRKFLAEAMLAEAGGPAGVVLLVSEARRP